MLTEIVYVTCLIRKNLIFRSFHCEKWVDWINEFLLIVLRKQFWLCSKSTNYAEQVQINWIYIFLYLQ